MNAAGEAGTGRPGTAERPLQAQRTLHPPGGDARDLAYFMLPLFWLRRLLDEVDERSFTTFGLWFADEVPLVENVGATLTYDDGIYLTGSATRCVYAVVAAGGATRSRRWAATGSPSSASPGTEP